MRKPRGESRLIVVLVVVIVASYFAAQLVLRSLDPNLNSAIAGAIEVSTIACLSSTALWWGVIRRLREQNRAQEFSGRLQTALGMAANESAGYDVVRRAVDATGIKGHVQLMLADSSEAHLKTVVDHAIGDAPPGCSVTAPFDCPAVRRAQTSRFDSSHALDACPWLVERTTGQGPASEIGAVCVPLNAVGRAIGVVHVATASREPISARQVRDLEAVAERAGSRIGMLRVMEQTHLQAATDSLTGLLNRRSVENKVHDLMRGNRKFALAMADLDHFKALNDTYGHATGDRALRVFARAIRGALRENDLVSRYGGEEFVLVFPDLSAADAARALERLRDALVLAITSSGVPSFTASFGVASSTDAGGIEDLLRLADTALFQAKRLGRNRVVVDNAPSDTSLATGSEDPALPPPEL